MFADPTVITPTGGANQSLVFIDRDNLKSRYQLRTTTDDWLLSIRNSQYKKANGKVTERHSIDLTHTIFAVAPATISTIRKVYLVFENEQGDVIADSVAEVGGLLTLLSAAANANVTKLIGNQS